MGWGSLGSYIQYQCHTFTHITIIICTRVQQYEALGIQDLRTSLLPPQAGSEPPVLAVSGSRPTRSRTCLINEIGHFRPAWKRPCSHLATPCLLGCLCARSYRSGLLHSALLHAELLYSKHGYGFTLLSASPSLSGATSTGIRLQTS